MTFGPVVQVLVGLIFMFFVFSVLSSGVNEYISRALQKRVDFLAAGISQLLVNKGGTPDKYIKAFWSHPLVKQLAQSLERTNEGRLRRAWRTFAQKVAAIASKVLVSHVGKAAQVRREDAEKFACAEADEVRRLPSYIPTATFVTVLEEITKNDPPPVGSSLRISLDALHSVDPAKRLANYGRWFDDEMDRVSGWYKRESKTILFVIGLLIVLAMNVDTIAVARTLWKDPTTRALVNNAVDAQLAANPTTTAPTGTTTAPAGTATTLAPATALQVVCKTPGTTAPVGTTTTTSPSDALRRAIDCATTFPIGWKSAFPDGYRSWTALLLKALGLLITACALSFGAPFWWDFLNRFANMRGAGAKPPTSSASSSS